MSNLRIESSGGLTRVTLARPEVRNAFNDELIGELAATFGALPAGTRVVVLGGDGQAFCAGADLAWMQRSVAYDEARNSREARELGAMFRAVDEAPCVVIARVQGAALGGGAGLVAGVRVRPDDGRRDSGPVPQQPAGDRVLPRLPQGREAPG